MNKITLITLPLLHLTLLMPLAGGAERAPMLEPLEIPVLDGMDEDVQRELGTRRDELQALLQQPDSRPSDLAQELGDLGGLYFLYGLLTHSEPALRNAIALDPEDFRWPYLLGFTYQSEGRLEEAAEQYERALALEPGYLAALIRLGNLRLDQHRLDDASLLFARALEMTVSTAAAHYGLGRVAVERGDATEAVAHFETALALQPAASAINYPLAQAHRQLGNADTTQRYLDAYGTREVVIPDPVIRRLRGLATGSAISFVRGQRALAAGDLEAAADLFRAAREADPESAPIRRALGLTLRRSGDIEAAIAEYRGAIELEPANPLNHQDLALALSDAGRFADAEVHFRRATELDDSFAEAYLGLGVVLSRQRRFPAALEALDSALELDPLDVAARFERAMLLARSSEAGRARQDLEAILATEPAHLSARINLARLLEIEGDHALAEDQARRALEQSPPAPSEARLRLLLGRLAEKRGDLSSATAEYQRAAEIAPDLAPASLRLGSVRARGGKLIEAAEAYSQVLHLAPRHHTARLARASSLIFAGHYREARATLEAGLEIDRQSPALAAELAVLLAGSPDPAVGDPEQSLANAQVAFRALGDAFSGQILALALAANERFEEAARAQSRIVASLEGAGAPVSEGARQRLSLFRDGISPLAPWTQDSALLAPAALPLETAVSD